MTITSAQLEIQVQFENVSYEGRKFHLFRDDCMLSFKLN
jgi:hypothetical protein